MEMPLRTTTTLTAPAAGDGVRCMQWCMHAYTPTMLCRGQLGCALTAGYGQHDGVWSTEQTAMCYYVLVLMLLLHAASRVNSYLPSFNVPSFQPRQAPHFPKLDGWIDGWARNSVSRIPHTCPSCPAMASSKSMACDADTLSTLHRCPVGLHGTGCLRHNVRRGSQPHDTSMIRDTRCPLCLS